MPKTATVAEVTPVMLTLAVLVTLSVFAGPVATYLEQTSLQLFDRDGYISAVLSPGGETHGVMLTRLIPHPPLSLTLVFVWLGLVNTFTLGNLILGGVSWTGHSDADGPVLAGSAQDRQAVQGD